MNIPFLKQHPRLRIALEWSLKIIIFALLAAAIYRQVFVNKDLRTVRQSIWQALQANTGSLILAVCLMPVNWLLETVKWRMLLRKVENLPFIKAFMAVLCGVTFTMFTPNRMGEYGGRFLFLKEPLRPAAFQATILGSISQIIATLLFGIIGLAFYFASGGNDFKLHGIFGFVWIIIAVPMLLTIYFSADVILEKLPLKERWKNILFAWVHYSDAELWQALLLAAARYCIFTVQYMLLLQAFLGHNAINMHYASGVSLVFLVQTIIPSIALFDLGVRGNAALTLLSNGSDGIGIVAAAFSLWIINLVLPAIVGSLIILSKRIFNR